MSMGAESGGWGTGRERGSVTGGGQDATWKKILTNSHTNSRIKIYMPRKTL